MKYMIASDIHGSALYARKMAEAFRREEADRLMQLIVDGLEGKL